MTAGGDGSLRVDHVSIAVRDIDTALAFFGRFLPLRMHRTKRPGYTSEFNWCDFHVGHFKLELIEPAGSGGFVHRFLDRRGEGLHHLSLETRELDPLVSRLERDGLRIVDHFDTGQGEKTAFISPRSAHGVLVQFWQVKEWEHPQRDPVATLTLRDGTPVRMYVDHVSLAVRSIDTALAFFLRHFPAEAEFDKTTGYDGSFNLATLRLNGYRIELIEEGARPGFVSRFLERRGEGFHHLSIDVDRLDPLVAQLEADGLRVVDKHDLGNGWKTAFLSPREAHGVLVQFWQDPRMSEPGGPLP